jgi:hypothetical protein
MTGPLLAEFPNPESLRAAMREVQAAGHRALDAFTPFPVDGLEEVFDLRPSRIRFVMLVTGVCVAALAYAIQWWSAIYDYPLNVGARPLNSWPVFLLAPFELGVLTAAAAGLISFFRTCGLPRLHNPLFEVPGFERATQDRFFLLAADRRHENGSLELRHLLESHGALVTEVPQA